MLHHQNLKLTSYSRQKEFTMKVLKALKDFLYCECYLKHNYDAEKEEAMLNMLKWGRYN